MENLKRKENDSTARNVMEKIYRNIKEKSIEYVVTWVLASKWILDLGPFDLRITYLTASQTNHIRWNIFFVIETIIPILKNYSACKKYFI